MFLHCPTCCSGFASQLALQDHVKTHMKAEAPSDCTCQVCGKVFSKRDHLRRHEATHSEIRPHKCHLCQSTFKRKDKLTAHLSTNHGIPSVSPTYGLKRIPPGSRMKEEEGSPSPGSSSAGRDFVCGFCFMGFTRKYHLDRHTSASHSGVKAHQCLDCGRRFTRKDHMERHQVSKETFHGLIEPSEWPCLSR